jgi:hypothetical protein
MIHGVRKNSAASITAAALSPRGFRSSLMPTRLPNRGLTSQSSAASEEAKPTSESAAATC